MRKREEVLLGRSGQMMALLASMGLRFGGQDDLFSFECVELRRPTGNPSGVFRKLLNIQMGFSGAMSTWSHRLGGHQPVEDNRGHGPKKASSEKSSGPRTKI